MLHHPAHLFELTQHPIDFLDRHACTCGDPSLARGFEQLGLGALERRHGIEDAFGASQLFFGLPALKLPGSLGELRGKLIQQRAHIAHFLDLGELVAKIIEVELIARLDLGGKLFGLGDVDVLVRLLDERDDVAHAQYALRHAFGVKRLKAVEFFRNPDELERLAGDVTHR